ncbi:MAG: glycosyltransferase family 61 protein [Alphaproteobacteria bacterium]|nr:glycosyltransferase family 61 protein [Alphaproteobacteria bacterium]
MEQAAYITPGGGGGSFNYHHCIYDHAVAIMELENLGYKGKYITLSYSFEFIKEFYRLLLGPERIVEIACGQSIQVEELIVIGAVYFKPADLHGSHIAFVRDRILPKIPNLVDEKYPKRLYVKRIGRRRISNELRIIEILKRYGFEVMTPEEHSVAEQIRYFHNADFVITPHGANSTNAIFMRPGTKFLELFSLTWGFRMMCNALAFMGVGFFELTEDFRWDMLDKKDIPFPRTESINRDFKINEFGLENMLLSILRL